MEIGSDGLVQARQTFWPGADPRKIPSLLFPAVAYSGMPAQI
jgi:hypothetical protein